MRLKTKNRPVPYQHLYQQLVNQIRTGNMRGKIPSIFQLTRHYNVSHNTVKKVLDKLKDQRFVYGMQGKGVFVNDTAVNSPAFQKHIVFYLHIETYQNPFYLHTLSILRQLVESENSIVHFVNSPEQLDTEEHIDTLLTTEISKIDEFHQITQRIDKGKIININETRNSGHYVGTDNFAGGYLAMEYLYSKGHRKIGIVTRDLDVKGCFFVDRYAGVLQFVKEHDDFEIFKSDIVIREDGQDYIPAQDASKYLLKNAPNITAIFSFTDILAMGVVTYCQNQRIRIPDDISILGFDDCEFAMMMSPPLTTIRENAEGVAQAAQKIIHQILKGNKSPMCIKRKPFLIERQSVKDIN